MNAEGFSRRRWILWTGCAETAGFAIPALVGTVASGQTGTPALGVGGFWLTMVAAGALEGLILGAAQAHVLGQSIPALERGRWVLATSLAAAFAWSLGMMPSSLGDLGIEFTALQAIALYVPLGIVLLFSLGFAQWLVLRRAIPRCASWIAWSALGWLAGLPFTFALLAAVPNGSGAEWFVAAGVAAGLAMAFVVAAVTAIGLDRILAGAEHGSANRGP